MVVFETSRDYRLGSARRRQAMIRWAICGGSPHVVRLNVEAREVFACKGVLGWEAHLEGINGTGAVSEVIDDCSRTT